MIPKMIHYCWFGHGKKSELIQYCIRSWEKYLSDYEIHEWNEDNFDVNMSPYLQQAYAAKKWAFVADYARLWILNQYGGIYLDTDIEILKPLDPLLEMQCFVGFEAKDMVNAAVMGATAQNKVVRTLLHDYSNANFLNEQGKRISPTIPIVLTQELMKQGLKLNGNMQKLSEVTVYPQSIFYPNNFLFIWGRTPQKTYTIHHAEQSWKSDMKKTSTLTQRLRRYLVGVLRNLVGTDNTRRLKTGLADIMRKKG